MLTCALVLTQALQVLLLLTQFLSFFLFSSSYLSCLVKDFHSDNFVLRQTHFPVLVDLPLF